MQDTPLAMVCFASRQLWPNLLGLLHYRTEIDRLFVYASANERESLMPGERLAHFARHFLEGRPVHPVEPLPLEAHDVAAQIAEWRAAYPGHRWLLQSTGGLKLMTLGAASLLGEAGVEMVYREVGTGWRQVRRTEDGRFASETLPLDDAAQVAKFSPTLFAMLQCGPNDSRQWRREAASSEPLEPLIERAISFDWDYARTMGSAKSGPGFERFVGALVLGLGAVRADLNVERGGSEFEIDVLATTPERIVLVDCKLDPTKDLAQAIDTNRNRARELGGLHAGVVMLWPNHAADDSNRLHAERNGVVLVTRPETPRLLGMLRKALAGKPLDSVAQALEERLVARVAGGFPVFSTAGRAPASTKDPESGLTLVATMRRNEARPCGDVRWHGLEFDGYREVWVDCPGLVAEVAAALKRLGPQGEPTRRGTSVVARFAVQGEKGRRLVARLEAELRPLGTPPAHDSETPRTDR